MAIPGIDLTLDPLPAPLPISRARVDAGQWLATARAVAAGGGRLVSLWGSDRGRDGRSAAAITAAYAVLDGLVCVELPLAGADAAYPALDAVFPTASRMQRAQRDLLGLVAEGARDIRPWLDHGAWPAGYAPLRQDASGREVAADRQAGDYLFVAVQGEGVHEIAVGPVHAGVIEPGHFRFSVVGEKVLRLEERLGYTHKGVCKRFTQIPPLEAHRLAGRVSGDSTVAYAFAYCMALESACASAIGARAAWLRALLLERERVANHLGDLGALGNDAALGFGLAQFSRLREDWLRSAAALFGHRLMMDCIVPGGVAGDLDQAGIARILRDCDAIEGELRVLHDIYEEHAGLQDRFIGAGRVVPELAARLGLTGLAGRASGQATDLRCDHPWPPFDALGVKMASHRNGDVATRVIVRFEETFESLRLIREICAHLPGGEVRVEPRLPEGTAVGIGWVEGWRGEILIALELDPGGRRIDRCHCHDPSWHNWPALEHAMIDNIVPDFPLINKSFNLSYSGHDL